MVGRKTYESFSRKPLPGRTNIVVTRDRSLVIPGALVTASLEAALDAARGDAMRRGVDEIAVVGGADIYAQTMDVADRLVITRVKMKPDGDIIFPPSIPSSGTRRSTQTTRPGQTTRRPTPFTFIERLNGSKPLIAKCSMPCAEEPHHL